MRTSEFLRLALIGFTVGATALPAVALDGSSKRPVDPAAGMTPVPPLGPDIRSFAPPGPGDAAAIGSVEDPFRRGSRLYAEGEKVKAVEELHRAAEQGHPLALWRLGRMYETGDGVTADPLKAFGYFSEIARAHAEETTTQRAAPSPILGGAYTAIGGYYLTGIENSDVKADPARARDAFTIAASYFGDRDAQYQLGRMYLQGEGGERDARAASRWLFSAAKKGHPGAQALFGQLLFTGDDTIQRKPVEGLMWLTIARAKADASDQDWILEAQEQAFSAASEAERRRAVKAANEWIARGGN